jgi:hypothetical protein
MLAYKNHNKTTSVKWKSRQKINTDRRDHHTLRRQFQKNHSTAAQMTAELNIILKTLFPQKLSNVSFTNPTFTVGLQLLNL